MNTPKEGRAFLIMARVFDKGGAPPLMGASLRALAPLADRFGADAVRDAMVSAISTVAINLRTVDGGRQAELTAGLFEQAATSLRAVVTATRAGQTLTPGGPLSVVSVPSDAVIGEPEGRA